MNILLDTHILIWSHEDCDLLSEKALQIIYNPLNTIYYSVINIWEAQMKHVKFPKEFTLTGDLLNSLSIQAGFKCLWIKPEHALTLKTLHYSDNAYRRHKDPFDRMLICQAKSENMQFLTHDELLPFYNEPSVVFV